MGKIIEELKEQTDETAEEKPAADFFMGILLMTFSGIVFDVAWSWPRSGGIASSAGLLPLLISATLFLMALIIFITSLKHKGYQRMINILKLSTSRKSLASVNAKLLFLTFSTILVYTIILLNLLPFEIATFLYVAGSLYLFWKEKIYKILIISIGITAFYSVTFKLLFKLALPGAGM
jgi:hypothetical protein